MGTKHGGILGRSQSGKSTVAKIICHGFTEAGRETLVYDITLSDEAVEAINEGTGPKEWDAVMATNEEEVFLEVFFASYDLIVFIDEGSETADRGKRDVKFTATRGSHQNGALGAGSSVFYAAHGYRDLNKTLRGQISEWFICGCSKETAQDLADLFDQPELLNASKLAVGEFYHVTADGRVGLYETDLENMTFRKIENSRGFETEVEDDEPESQD